ncbi:hypothetical protein BMS3Abin02_01061 [bacterium BMS3Abin02]|nr:hypothetical protein BMS3Abin02_01061 [bacterium BMS3Abin02]GBE21333.1 hypothetical protein BMS3Bbin01_00675 [bacterium BMS3Bbin01]HDK46172.1 hypothetical protein [Actinomycetota bacterium]HDL49293.1 hypothetical protein [Actinomycetota bacterium]
MGGVRRAVARRPDLWLDAARSVFAFAPKAWWKKFPFLPVPETRYLAWRRFTAYGSVDQTLSGEDVVAFLEWRRRLRTSR